MAESLTGKAFSAGVFQRELGSYKGLQAPNALAAFGEEKRLQRDVFSSVADP